MWDKLKEQFNLLKLEKKKLYLVTNSDKFISKDEFLDAIASALQGGVDIIQLRETSIPDKVIVEIGHKIRILCDEYGATFIVNNRADIAAIVEADGVHLGENDISVPDARTILGQHGIIGKTCHNPDEIIGAVNDGADYIILGPVGEIEQDYINWALENIDIPVFVFGDITLSSMSKLASENIHKIVVKDSLMYARIPEQTAREFLKYLP